MPSYFCLQLPATEPEQQSPSHLHGDWAPWRLHQEARILRSRPQHLRQKRQAGDASRLSEHAPGAQNAASPLKRATFRGDGPRLPLGGSASCASSPCPPRGQEPSLTADAHLPSTVRGVGSDALADAA